METRGQEILNTLQAHSRQYSTQAHKKGSPNLVNPLIELVHYLDAMTGCKISPGYEYPKDLRTLEDAKNWAGAFIQSVQSRPTENQLQFMFLEDIYEAMDILQNTEQEHASDLRDKLLTSYQEFRFPTEDDLISMYAFLRIIGWKHLDESADFHPIVLNAHSYDDLKKLAAWTATQSKEENVQEEDFLDRMLVTFHLLAESDLNSTTCSCSGTCVQEILANMEDPEYIETWVERIRS